MDRTAPTFGKTDIVHAAIATLRDARGLRDDADAAQALDRIACWYESSIEEMREQLARETARSEMLGRAVGLARAPHDLAAVLQEVLGHAIGVTGAERGLVVRREGRTVLAERNITPQERPQCFAFIEEVLASGRNLVRNEPAGPPKTGAAHGFRSIVVLPLRSRDETIGAIYLDSAMTPGGFGRRDHELLALFVNQATLAIENARLFAEERARLDRIGELQDFQTRILETIANGVLTFDPAGCITSFNRAAETTFALEASLVIGGDAASLAPYVPEFPELFALFYESGAVHLRAEIDACDANRTERTLEIRIFPLASDEGTGAAVVIRDLTVRRALEAAHAADTAHAIAIESTFSRYLAPHVVRSLISDPHAVRLGGERLRATTLFADIRGFTSIAATLSAERIVDLLNIYFTEAVGAVFAFDGLLDKFYGDGLMAVFGPPRVRPDDAARALRAAVALHKAVAIVAPRLDHPLTISIGLATGDVVAGHVGSARRVDYTVIGDPVNLAMGLQHVAPAGTIVCDERTYEDAGRIFPATRILVKVKGRGELVPAYAFDPYACRESIESVGALRIETTEIFDRPAV